MFKVEPNFPVPGVDGQLDFKKQAEFNSGIALSLTQGGALLAQRLNAVLPKDGSEPMTGPLTGLAGTFNGQLIGKGTVLGDSAAAGYIGEVMTNNVPAGSGVALVTNTPKTVMNLNLTPGDWDVFANAGFTTAATTNWTILAHSISLVTNTHDTTPGQYQARKITAGDVPTASSFLNVFGMNYFRVNVTVLTPVYLIASSAFTVSTMDAYGFMSARRMR